MSFAQTLMHYNLGHHPVGGNWSRRIGSTAGGSLTRIGPTRGWSRNGGICKTAIARG